jgi:hypothetical protein
MRYKDYTKKEIQAKKYVIIGYDYEDGTTMIMSLHDDEEKAHRRCRFLNKESIKNMDINLIDYFVITTDELLTNKKYAYMFESEDE